MTEKSVKIQDKDIKDIRPAAGGVRLKRKTPPKKKPAAQPDKAKIVQDIRHDQEVDSLEPPTEEAARLLNTINSAKSELMDIMREYNNLLNTRVLEKNKSLSMKESEQGVVSALFSSAKKLDAVTDGEGTLGLIVLSLRHILSLRDLNNNLSHKVHVLESNERALSKPGEDKQKAVEFLLEKAKELGINISIDENEEE